MHGTNTSKIRFNSDNHALNDIMFLLRIDNHNRERFESFDHN